MKKFLPPLLFLMFSGTAFASTDRFNYDPSDLATPAAIEKLHVKVEQFARMYCNMQTQTLDRFQSCVDGIEEELVEKINDTRLSDYAANGPGSGNVAAG